MMTVSGSTRLYGIMGDPVTHSLSPLMQTCAFQYHGLDCLYVAFPVAPQRLAAAVAGVVALGIVGFNVTLPHKETILAYLDEVSTQAQFIGAVNTVRIHNGRTIGYNTDGAGFLQPLRARSVALSETPACVLGAGGAARAICMALVQAGCPAVVIANRTYARGARLAAALQERSPQARVRAVALAQAEAAVRQSRLIVNATSVGSRQEGVSLVPETCFGPDQLVYDIVYRPLHTPLLQAARRRGATVIPGIDMLIGQGAEAFRIWTGSTFPVAAVRRVLEPFLDPAEAGRRDRAMCHGGTD